MGDYEEPGPNTDLDQSFELEVVVVEADNYEGHPLRHLHCGLVNEYAAREVAHNMVREACGHISGTHVIRTGRLGVSLAYTGPHGQIVGYANIARKASTLRITAQSSEIGRMVREMYAATGMRLAIDADCPGCGWPERWFNGDDFGCNKCDYISKER